MQSEFEQILEGLGNDQSHAQTAVFDEYYDQLVRLVRGNLPQKLRPRVDASDVAMSAFRSFFINARGGAYQITDRSQLWKLLVTITLNKMRNQRRRHLAQKRSIKLEKPTLGSELTTSPGPADLAVLNDELEVVLSDLTPLHREIGERILMGQPSAEIANIVNRSVRTVRRIEADIKEQLVTRLGLSKH